MATSIQDHACTEISWDPLVSAYLGAALGVDKFRQIQAAIAVPPLTTCLRVNTLRNTTQDVLQQLQHDLPQHSSRFAPHPDLPVAILLKGSGPNYINPAAAGVTKQVLISRKAGESVLRGAQVFVPGVLACSAGLAAGDLVVVTAALDLPGTSNSGITRGTVIAAKEDSNNSSITRHLPAADKAAAGTITSSGSRLCVGIGRAAMGRAEMFRASHGVAVEMVQRVYDVPSPPIDGHLKGSVMLQNLPSIVAAQVLNPRPGSKVLDMCAAPGGKTTMLAQIMGGVGEIIALDRSHGKVDDIKALASELGCSSCVQAHKADSTKAVITPEQQQQQQQQQQQFGGEQQPQLQRTPQPQQKHRKQHQQSGHHPEQLRGRRQQLPQINGHQSWHPKQPPQQQPAPPPPPPRQQQQQQQPHQEQQQQQQQARTQQKQLQQVPQPPRLQQPQQEPGQEARQEQTQHVQKQDAQTSSRKLLLLLQEAEKLQRQQVVLPADSSGLSAKAVARMQRRLAAMVARGQPAAPAIQAEFRYYGFGPAKSPGFPPETFDHVLLDAPCTALGLRPRLQQQHTLGLLLETAAYQRALLYAAVQLLKPGGHLVFSTCTISPAENEVNVRHLLDTYPCLKLVPAEPRIGGPGLTGPADVQALKAAVAAAAEAAAGGKRKQAAALRVNGSQPSSATPTVVLGSKWGGVGAWCQERWLTPEEADKVQRFDPSGPEDTIGFFIAKFEKVCSC